MDKVKEIQLKAEFPYLTILVFGIWDGSVSMHEIVKDQNHCDIFLADRMCGELNLTVLPFSDDPKFEAIKNHKNYDSLKRVLEPHDDLEMP